MAKTPFNVNLIYFPCSEMHHTDLPELIELIDSFLKFGLQYVCLRELRCSYVDLSTPARVGSSACSGL